MTTRTALVIAALALAACDQTAPAAVEVQRVDIGEERMPMPEVIDSPDTSDAIWTVREDGQAIRFGDEGGPPMMSLVCRRDEDPPRMLVVRHVQARPGVEALFPVLGNGTRSRFEVDAALVDGEWRYQGEFDAGDTRLDVFTGPRALEATLPAGGMLEIAGSHIPGEFVEWCRAGGGEATDADEESSETPAME